MRYSRIKWLVFDLFDASNAFASFKCGVSKPSVNQP
jgi:hypothetical protein